MDSPPWNNGSWMARPVLEIGEHQPQHATRRRIADRRESIGQSHEVGHHAVQNRGDSRRPRRGRHVEHGQHGGQSNRVRGRVTYLGQQHRLGDLIAPPSSVLGETRRKGGHRGGRGDMGPVGRPVSQLSGQRLAEVGQLCELAGPTLSGEWCLSLMQRCIGHGSHPRKWLTIGMRRSRPNPRVVTFGPSGVWRRLNSAPSTRRTTWSTRSGSWPSATSSARVRLPST